MSGTHQKHIGGDALGALLATLKQRTVGLPIPVQNRTFVWNLREERP